MYNGVTLLYNNNEHNIVNQYTSIKNTHTQQKKKKQRKGFKRVILFQINKRWSKENFVPALPEFLKCPKRK